MTEDRWKLDQIQKWMQAVITHPEGIVAGVESPNTQEHLPVPLAAVERVVSPSKMLSSLQRLQIYGNAYYARLVECLREEFPAVAVAMGTERFDAYAMGYLQSYPSQSYTLGQLGRSFAGFLSETLPEYAGDVPGPFLVDLADLERLYSEVFDGPGLEGQATLAREDLERIPAERWPAVKLIPAPSFRLKAYRFPVHQFITASHKGESPAIPVPEPTLLAINRRDFVVRRQRLDELQFAFLSQILAGNVLGVAIEKALAETDADFEQLAEQLQAWFRDWTAWQFFARVELS